MKKFFVSKSDNNKVDFINQSIKDINPDYVYILCDNDRKDIFKDVNATILPLKELNKATNWITFVNTFSKDSLLIIDNVLQFIFFGDGKKKYLKDVSQSIDNIIVMDIVPFYTEPHEIFYPFWFLGKDILGYNSYSTFKANHLEEKEDGSVYNAHSFSVLKDKIKNYYIQDYKCFWNDRTYVDFELTTEENTSYEERKIKEKELFTNPIKMFNACSNEINLCESRFKKVAETVDNNLFKKIAVVINCGGIYPKMYLKNFRNKNVDFLTIHTNPIKFKGYDVVILAEMPIVKPHNWMYIETIITGDIYQLRLKDNNLEQYFHYKIFDNETRKQFDSNFCNANL